jgi:hypothetical protein
MEDAGAGEVALGMENAAKDVEAPRSVRVIRSQASFADRQGALGQGPGAVEVALGA